MIFSRKSRQRQSILAKSIAGGQYTSPNKPRVNKIERNLPSNRGKKVFSYYARTTNPDGENIGRKQENITKKYGFRLKHLPSYVALFAIIAAGFYSCYLQPNPRIIILNSPGTIQQDSKVYQDGIREIWEESIFNKSKLTVRKAKITQKIHARYPEISDAQLELSILGRRPTVVLIPAKPALQLVSNNGTYFVDMNGKVMSNISAVKQNELPDLALVRDETGIASEAGTNVLSGPETLYIKNLYDQLKIDGVNVQSITLPLDSARQADVRIVGQAYYIKFSFDSDARQAVGTYLVAKSKLDSDNVVPTEYIDVRTEEKVFYK